MFNLLPFHSFSTVVFGRSSIIADSKVDKVVIQNQKSALRRVFGPRRFSVRNGIAGYGHLRLFTKTCFTDKALRDASTPSGRALE